MKKHLMICLGCGVLGLVGFARGDNPLLMDTFAADPTARVFEGKVYLYPSHDILPPAGSRGGFRMEDYHVYSSENLLEWTDHGVIVTQTEVPWVTPDFSMWAPDCVFKNGKYYFYFPADSKDIGARGRGVKKVGVAIADKPFGPFKPEPTSIPGIPPSIDPCVLIDPKDGAAYLYYSMNAIFVAKLKDNMVELAEAPTRIANLPEKGLVEGPFAFERQGEYYLSFPHDVGGGEALEYAMSDSPRGPFTMKGTIMDKSASGCWTNHHSLVEYQGRWTLFYHDMELSPNGRDSARRSARADYVSFNPDGTIQKVIPTLRGVGIADARRPIQVDRYTNMSKEGAAVAFIDQDRKNLGWKTTLTGKGAYVQYDRVDFGKTSPKAVKVRSLSTTGGVLEIRLDGPDGPVIASVSVSRSEEWTDAAAALAGAASGVHNLVVMLPEPNAIEVDWVRFE